ncbi:MAG: hypothetical protein IJZ72_01355 [Oscillospiraceae bacterium]|nr:hypothetical protein [Oscillospiraceae bacterium]
MDDRRCPFCGGMLLDKVCIDCGFEHLTEEEIAAPYDFEPDNDSFGEEEKPAYAGMDGITLSALDGSASVGMESISLSNIPAPKIQTPPPPIVKKTPVNTNVQPNPPPAPLPPVQPQLSGYEKFVKDVADYIRKHWWMLLLTLLIPTSGYIIGGVYITVARHSDGTKAILTGIAYIIASTLLKAAGVDILGIDVVLGNLLFELLKSSRRRRYRYY